jgi:hypothetical protein
MFQEGVDPGKHGTKAVCKGKNFYVRTKVEQANADDVINGNTYAIEYKGIKYLIGEEVPNSDYDLSKAKIGHKLAMYLATGMLLDGKNEDVQIITGCPLLTFINSELKEAYRQYLFEDKNIDMSIDGKKVKFSIKDIKILPESIGFPYRDVNKYINSLVGVIYIGGLNANAAIYDKLRPIKSTIFTINEGGNILLNKIKRELNKQLQLNFQDYEIPYLFDSDDKRINEIINDVLHQQLDRIFEEAKKYNWNLNNLPLAFSGGGSLLLSNVIREKKPNAIISEDPIWDNANAYYMIGGLMNEQD